MKKEGGEGQEEKTPHKLCYMHKFRGGANCMYVFSSQTMNSYSWWNLKRIFLVGWGVLQCATGSKRAAETRSGWELGGCVSWDRGQVDGVWVDLQGRKS